MPGDENKPEAVTEPGQRLILDFKQIDGTKITDASGKENHGTLHGTAETKGENSEPARQFDGKSFIDVQKSPTINVANIPWTTEIVFKAEAPNGVLLGLGGSLCSATKS